MRPGSYDAWGVREEDFPRRGTLPEQLRFLVRYGILAPSAHNTQPWAFAIRENHLRVSADASRALTVSDPTRRELIMSIGACVTNLRVAAEHFGFRGTTEEFPLGDENVVADIAVAADASVRTAEGDRLFAAITERHANRLPFQQRAVPPEVLMKFRSLASASNLSLFLVDDPVKIRALAEVTERATAESMASPAFRGELSQWVRSNFTKRPDGMPGFVNGIPDVPSLAGTFLVKLPPVAKAEGKKRRDQVISSPLVAIIATPRNEKRDWLHAGMLLERLWLLATAEHLSVGVLSAAIETGEWYTDVQRVLGTDLRPQAFFRVGYSSDHHHPTPRRPVDEVMIP